MGYTYAKSYLGGDNKVKFIERTKQQIKVVNLLLNRLEILKDTLLDFDNKVLNIRFKKALGTATEQLEHTSFSLSQIFYDSYHKHNNAKIRIGFYGDERCVYIENRFSGYLPEYNWEFTVLVDVDKRILATETIDLLNKDISHFEKRIVTMQDCIDNYDKYMEKSIEIERLINEYKESVPYMVQLNTSVGRPYEF